MSDGAQPDTIRIAIPGGQYVFGLLLAPADALACFVFAHGAGAGMAHPFMARVADGLIQRRIATLRYNFPYVERGSRRPDRPDLAQSVVRAAVDTAARLLPAVPLVAGGKSFGARMTSQAQAAEPLPGVVCLIFLGFPLHPSGKPSAKRAAHLDDVTIPMVFLQGDRDTLADLTLLRPVIERLGAHAMLKIFNHADHSFHVLVRSGTSDAAVMTELLDTIAEAIAQRFVHSL